jgi:fluoride exporter
LDGEPGVEACRVDPSLVHHGISLASPDAGETVFTDSERSVLRRHGVTYLLIGIGGFLGANARYLVASWITERLGGSFPYGTLIINVSGSFILGFFLEFISERLFVHPNWRLFFAIGFLGAYTTFSTFSFESLALLQEGSYFAALANMVGSMLLGLTAVVTGIIVARLL